MDSLQDLLKKKDNQEPAEVVIIRKFVHDTFQSDCSVMIRTNQIVIRVTSASLAGALRMKLHELQKLCPTEKRLSIAIG